MVLHKGDRAGYCPNCNGRLSRGKVDAERKLTVKTCPSCGTHVEYHWDSKRR